MNHFLQSQFYRRQLCIAVIVACGAAPSWVAAHHSFALYSQTETTKIKGVVSRFTWTNPHVTIYVETAGPSPQRFKVETGSVNALRRMGWTSESVKVGAETEVSFNPLKTGEPGGLLVEIKMGGVVLTGGG